MVEDPIACFVAVIDRFLMPSGHLCLRLGKFHLAYGIAPWPEGTLPETIGLLTWDKQPMPMGCCARGQAEYLVVLQKTLERVKWVDRSAQQTRCLEREDAARWPPFVYGKPVGLQADRLAAVTSEGIS